MRNTGLSACIEFLQAVDTDGLWVDEFHYTIDKTFIKWRGYRLGRRQSESDFSTAMLEDRTVWAYVIQRMRQSLAYPE